MFSYRSISVWLLLVALVAAVYAGNCRDGDGPDGDCAAGSDETSWLALHRQVPIDAPEYAQEACEGPAGRKCSWKNSVVQCPGSDQKCNPRKCCPGIDATNGRTFPCPTAGRDEKCEGARDDLINALLAAMTKEEKYGFIRGTGWVNGSWDITPGYYIGDAGLHQRFGIPAQNMEDNGQGFRTVTKKIIRQVTSWPCTLAVATSWSEEDTRTWAVAMGKEFKIKGSNVILGPGVNVHRVGRGGRNAEYVSGESPYFGARMVVPYVEGVQSEGVLAVVKHFVLNNQETHRDTVDSIVDNRTMWEVYYPPIEAAVKAGVAAAMCSYNLVNSVHSCGNPETLLGDFKGKMGFKGWVQSDWWAVHSFVAEDGVDQEMPGDSTPTQKSWYTNENLDSLSKEKVDDMVGRQLTMMHRHGLFEPKNKLCQPPDCDYELYEANATSEEHQALCRELATKAVLLLKNEDNVLPLTKNTKRIAVLGSACNAPQDVDQQMKVWDLGSYYNIGGSGRVIAWDPVTIYDGLKETCEEHGCKVAHDFSDDANAAAAAAADSDVAFICGGTTATEAHDRKNLSVDQENFLVDIAEKLSSSMPVISVTMTPGTIVMPWLKHTKGVLNAFLNGKYTGTAFADVIFGKSNPSGKSPITFPVSEDQMIPPCEETACPYKEGLRVGFPALAGQNVNFPFGHGLSYTSFKYEFDQLSIPGTEANTECKGAALCVHAMVENSGDVAGVEVAQLYMNYPEHAGEPGLLLRGFVRTSELKPKDKVKVIFPLFERDLQTWTDNNGGWTTPNGPFGLAVGGSSRDVRFRQKFSVCSGKVELVSNCRSISQEAEVKKIKV